MDKIWTVVQHFVYMLIGGTVDTVTYDGLLTPITNAVLNNPVLVIPIGIMVIGVIFAIIGKLFRVARKA